MKTFSLALINSTLPIRMCKFVIKVLSLDAHCCSFVLYRHTSYHGVRLAITTHFSIALNEKNDTFFTYNCIKIQVKVVRRQHLPAF